ncbi:sigma-70 family RNA polymerase sigma factor [Saccharibacillus alkalitolerans]|uniref:Sigma-70 family RNA polymerase sigma factor n=1 Tax=Saccharibacillus alkalitolerans TaxID=2705290 RepID=A0ABX0F6J0_9BACL|nr:sigma-70 family RNA polymerase sigma factor [Saccharibacillus alkalitolerans]NGZ75164.1 sigma-70 family RNA polymerase sigma factor [Saccharibacillus alkalitolerans]
MEENTIGYYRRELERAAWRERYYQRKKAAREIAWSDSGRENEQADPGEFEAECAMREYLELIPFDNGRKVMRALYAEGKTEAAAAAELRISQQGVSKWKRKSLEHLRRTLDL